MKPNMIKNFSSATDSRRACAAFTLTLALTLLLLLLSPSALAQPQPQESPTPTPTPVSYPPQLLKEMRELQQAALDSDYAYRQVAHLSNNIGNRLSGSAQAEQAVQYG